MKRWFHVALLSGLLSWSSFTLAAPSSLRGPSGCPPNVDSANWVCLTPEEARQIKLEKLNLQDQLIDLRLENQKLRARVPSGIRRFANPWATIGAERLINENTYHPYGLAGLDFGHLSVWGGFFGEEPAAGVGWKF